MFSLFVWVQTKQESWKVNFSISVQAELNKPWSRLYSICEMEIIKTVELIDFTLVFIMFSQALSITSLRNSDQTFKLHGADEM